MVEIFSVIGGKRSEGNTGKNAVVSVISNNLQK
jgi:hypothetical protein